MQNGTPLGQMILISSLIIHCIYLSADLYESTGSNCCYPGPSCSKLTRSLVNISFKFQMLISEIRHYFLLKKLPNFSLIFSTKNICLFGNKVVKHLTS